MHLIYYIVGISSLLSCTICDHDHFWVMQASPQMKAKYRRRLGKKCTITRIPLAKKNNTGAGANNRTERSGDIDIPPEDVDLGGNSNVARDVRHAFELDDTNDRRFSLRKKKKKKPKRKEGDHKKRAGEFQKNAIGGSAESSMQDLVIDQDCNNEENRAFMECVLNYKPDIKETDPGYNEGVCMCYRDWSINSARIPAYNHVIF